MNRIWGRWLKAGALLVVAAVLVVGCEGAAGIPGAVGPAGPQGEKGEPGEPGATGPQGPQGEQGPQGQPGAAGPQGEPGATGPQGDPGVDGAPGADGAPGEIGPQGQPGSDVDAGPAVIGRIGGSDGTLSLNATGKDFDDNGNEILLEGQRLKEDGLPKIRVDGNEFFRGNDLMFEIVSVEHPMYPAADYFDEDPTADPPPVLTDYGMVEIPTIRYFYNQEDDDGNVLDPDVFYFEIDTDTAMYGPSTVTMRATDMNGLWAEQEFVIRYNREPMLVAEQDPHRS